MLDRLQGIIVVLLLFLFSSCIDELISWLVIARNLKQRGSVVRVGDLNAEDPGSNSRLGLLNEFVLGDPRDKLTTLCK